MKHEQLSYPDALRFLAKKYHIDIQERELTDEEKRMQSDRESMFIVNSWAQKHFISRLYEHEEGRTIGMAYFLERGFREDIIRKFQLGYSLEKRDDLYQTALKSGYKKEFLEKTGLVMTHDNGAVSDRFRGRVIFPVHTLSGKVVAFGGRILRKNEKTAKYINSPESEIYHKSDELYGIFLARKAIIREDKCFLVEGYTDVISMHQSGIENVVASSGTALTQGQIHVIHRITNNITVIYDGDAAGIKAAIRGIDLLLEEGMNVKIILLPDGEDPDSFSRKHNAFEFTMYVNRHETDFIRFKTRLLLDEVGNDPIRRVTLVSDIIRSIAVIPDSITRAVYVKECSNLLEIREQVLLDTLNRMRAERQNLPPSPRPLPAPPPDVVPAFEAAPPPDASPYKAYEEALIRYVVLYGERTLFDYMEEDQHFTVRVAEYIQSELRQDDIAFTVPHYKNILDEAVTHSLEPDFVASRYFLSHSDPLIGRTAILLMDNAWQPFFENAPAAAQPATRREQEETERLLLQQMEAFEHAIRRDLFALKDAYIRKQINDIKHKIKYLQTEGKIDEAFEQMKKQQFLNEIKKKLNKELGERIIVVGGRFPGIGHRPGTVSE
jgi:DNA primase